MERVSATKYTTPTFKVSIKKREQKISKITSQSFEKFNKRRNNVRRVVLKNEGMNIYMTRTAREFIPSPPQVISDLMAANCNHRTKNSKRKPKATRPLLNARKLGKESKKVQASEGKIKHKRINPFIAFRSYYSKFVSGKMTQQRLSIILSSYWASNSEVQRIWDVFAQHYNGEDTKLGFSEWLEQNYESRLEVNRCKCNKEEAKESFVEDVYSQSNEFNSLLSFLDLQELKNLESDWGDTHLNPFNLEYLHLDSVNQSLSRS